MDTKPVLRSPFPVCETGCSSRIAKSVSIIITSHNYGQYLEEAIQSALDQTHPVSEILVVDDASIDNTWKVAETYASEGVRHMRVEVKNVHLARRSGFENTSGEIVLFLDGDNMLSHDYVEKGVAEYTHRNIGVVYADLLLFGRFPVRTTCFPAYSRALLFRENFVDASALIRRDALEVSDVFDRPLDGIRMPEDYYMFQRLAQVGWEFRKQKSVLRYRIHDRQKHQRARVIRGKAGYFVTHGLNQQDVMLFVPLCGREFAWGEMHSFLERQTWPHSQIRLVLCDSSQDVEFSKAVRRWMADCDYPDVRHVTLVAGRKGLADDDRYKRKTELEVQHAMCRIYNRLRSALETDYCWILEDDIIPPDDVLQRLMQHFRPNVASVSAVYSSRFDGKHVVWNVDPEGMGGAHRIAPPELNEPQVEEVRGSGFGCIVFRSEVIRNHVFSLPKGEKYYDPYFFKAMGEEWKRICDWTCECRHLDPGADET